MRYDLAFNSFILVCLIANLSCEKNHLESKSELFLRQDKRIIVCETSPLRKKLHVSVSVEKELASDLTVPATVEVDPAEQVKIFPPFSGRIAKIHVKLGGWIKNGQALISLDSPDFHQSLSDYAKAKAQSLQSKRAVERARKLAVDGAIAKTELEAAELDNSNSESEFKRCGLRLSQLGISANSEQSSPFLVVRSPISGRVSEFTAAKGGYWNDQTASLMVISNLEKVWIVAQVQEKDISRIKLGQEAEATLSSYPGESFRGKVANVGDLLDPTTRALKVRMEVDNPSYRLLPAMFANMTFHTKPHKGVIVPVASIIQKAFGAFIFVEVAPWTFEIRSVKEGPQLNGGMVEVIEGLKPGERLIVKEGVLLDD